MFRLSHSFGKAAAFYCVILLILQSTDYSIIVFLLLMCIRHVSIKITYLLTYFNNGNAVPMRSPRNDL